MTQKHSLVFSQELGREKVLDCQHGPVVGCVIITECITHQSHDNVTHPSRIGAYCLLCFFSCDLYGKRHNPLLQTVRNSTFKLNVTATPFSSSRVGLIKELSWDCQMIYWRLVSFATTFLHESGFSQCSTSERKQGNKLYFRSSGNLGFKGFITFIQTISRLSVILFIISLQKWMFRIGTYDINVYY